MILAQFTGGLGITKECFLQGGRSGLLAQLACAALGQAAAAAPEHQPAVARPAAPRPSGPSLRWA